MEEPLIFHCHTNASIQLTKAQGAEIESLIYKETGCRISSYAIQVGISDTNISAYLLGRKKITYNTLVKLLSRIPYTVECETRFVVKKDIGSSATNADCQSIEEQLFLEEMAMSMEEEQSRETASISTGEESQQKHEKLIFYNPFTDEITTPANISQTLPPLFLLFKQQSLLSSFSERLRVNKKM